MARGQKRSVYFPAEMLDEITAESQRLDRNNAWLIQQAWTIARDHVRTLPSAPADTNP